MKKDNHGLVEKIRLRREALSRIGESRLVLEAYAGVGEVGRHVYAGATGVAIERDEEKAGILAANRPNWRVYEADSCSAIAGGIASDLRFEVVDFDPYGDPWPGIRALFGSSRAMASRFAVVVNDGLRQPVKMGIAWRCRSLDDAVSAFGCDLYPAYLDVCRWMMRRCAASAAAEVVEFRGFYGGFAQQMTHYYAIINCPGELRGTGK